MSKLLVSLVALAAFAFTAQASEPHAPFRADMAAGSAYTLDAAQLHPTQFALGWREVVFKRGKIERKSPTDLVTYLKEKDVPVVIGPGGVPYMTDGHHTIRALWESNAPDKTVYGHVLANWSDLSAEEFWSRMATQNYVYLRDAQGQPQPAAKLPATLREMQLDPYRGLAWAVMDAGGFRERKDVFFQEFHWADFFRQRLKWDDSNDADFHRALNEARALARTPEASALPGARPLPLQARVITEPVKHDTDDPAIWINPADPAKSLVIGTDKDSDGALYAFDLKGKIVGKTERLRRPNNVDIITGFPLGGRLVDIAVTTEREAQRLRVFSLPDLRPLDRGDLIVFEGDKHRAPMGIALYRRPSDGAFFAIVGGKSGPAQDYLAQYRLEDDGAGGVKMTLARYFGAYSGKKEIEAIAVDGELGFIYYSDEQFGVRKYAADPAAPDANRELALFATTGFVGDHEGISIYATAPGRGYVIVSNQQADAFVVFPREGTARGPHDHPAIGSVEVSAVESDGSDVTNAALPGFSGGLFVAMSTDRTFHYYAWDDFARAAGLKRDSSR